MLIGFVGGREDIPGSRMLFYVANQCRPETTRPLGLLNVDEVDKRAPKELMGHDAIADDTLRDINDPGPAGRNGNVDGSSPVSFRAGNMVELMKHHKVIVGSLANQWPGQVCAALAIANSTSAGLQVAIAPAGSRLGPLCTQASQHRESVSWARQ